MKRNPWPIVITALCVVAFASATTIVVVMVRQKVDLVTPDYYEKDLKHGELMAREQRARALETPLTVVLDSASRAITVTFPASGATGEITLYRPSSPDMDRVVPVSASADRQQVIPADELASGLWRVQVAWSQGGLDYFASESVVLP
jgi:hypothetical protein